MPRTPLFSTYRQGENRVTASMLAVFERISLDALEQLIASASSEATLGFVSFDNQHGRGSRSVPDASIAASFHYLFEVKTARNAVRVDQLGEHLGAFSGSSGADQRLFLITPDGAEPGAVTSVDDPRVTWFNFVSLSEAIDELLADDSRLLADQEVFLLRELQALFEADGLLSTDDVVVVAARRAYPEYLRYHAYVCQPSSRRSFRDTAERIGFYHGGAIEPEVPLIVHREGEVVFLPETAQAFETSGAPGGDRIAEVIRRTLADGTRVHGHSYAVFLLSAPDDDATLRLPTRVVNAATNASGRTIAWTRGQRYASSERLRAATTTDDL